MDQLMEIVPLELEDIVECLFYFFDVCVACFSEDLHPDYGFKISRFFTKYKELNISIIPKVHLLGIHVPRFIAFYEKAMGIFSEQVRSFLAILETLNFEFLVNLELESCSNLLKIKFQNL